MTTALNEGLLICDKNYAEERKHKRNKIKRLKRTSDQIRTASSTTTSVSNTTLQDLPIEVLDYILLKVVVKKVIDKKLAKCAWIGCASREIQPMRRVWSQWDHRLTTNWFKIVLKRNLNKKNPTPISGTTIAARPCSKGRHGFAQLGREYYFVNNARFDKGPGSFAYCALTMCDDYDLTRSTMRCMLPLDATPKGIAVCKRSNAIYFWGCSPDVGHVLRLSPKRNSNLLGVLNWPTYSPPSGLLECPDWGGICIDSFSVLDDGNILVKRSTFLKEEVEDEVGDAFVEEMVLSIHRPDGSVLRSTKLPHSYCLDKSNVEMKSNGNFVYALLDNRVVKEVDQDGREIRNYEWEEKGIHAWGWEKLFLDSYDRVIIQDGAFDLIILDAEFNLMGEVHLERPRLYAVLADGVRTACFDKDTNELNVLFREKELHLICLTM